MLYTCNKCGEEKEEELFPREKRNGIYRVRVDACKECRRIYTKAYEQTPDFRKRASERTINHRKTLKGKLGMLAQAARDRAKKLGIPCDITYDYIRQLWEKQAGLDAYTGEPMTYDGSDRWTALSLDRIDPSEGYVEGNIQLLTMLTNTMKTKMTHSEFITRCKLIIDKSSETIENTSKEGSE